MCNINLQYLVDDNGKKQLRRLDETARFLGGTGMDTVPRAGD